MKATTRHTMSRLLSAWEIGGYVDGNCLKHCSGANFEDCGALLQNWLFDQKVRASFRQHCGGHLAPKCGAILNRGGLIVRDHLGAIDAQDFTAQA